MNDPRIPGTEPSLPDRYQALVRLSHAVSAHRDPAGLIRALGSELRDVVQTSLIAVVLCDEEGRLRQPPLGQLFGQPLDPMPLFSVRESITWWVFEHQQPLVIPDVDEEERFPESMMVMKTQGIRSTCTLPLTTAHRRLGILSFGSERSNAFLEAEVRFLSLVADEVAVAIDDALNFNATLLAQGELEQEKNRLKLLLDLTNVAVSSLEIQEVARAISANLRRIMMCDCVGMALSDADSGQLRFYALDFPGCSGVLQKEGLLPIESVAGKVFATGSPWLGGSGDLAVSGLQGTPIAGLGLQSACVLPLISRDRILGVLLLAGHRPGIFAPQGMDFLMQVAGQTAIAVGNALDYRQIAELQEKLAHEKLYLESELREEATFGEIVGKSPVLLEALRLVAIVAKTDATVLILGETGTGKELFARAIHNESPRMHRTFVKLNCAAIPTGLLESELFGHERGAFTGAIGQKIGRFELADQGTMFLDEIGDIPLELQPKLLRALQDREFERLGSTTTRKSNVRLVAATHRDLPQMVEDSQFRRDLYYRLNVFPITIPALRERAEDIPLLAGHFTRWYARRMNKTIDTIPTGSMKKMMAMFWPGNVRELENLIERAVILTRGDVLNVPVSELDEATPGVKGAPAPGSPERDRLLLVLKETRGRVGGPRGAAVRLGLKRTTLAARLKKFGIRPREVS